jgi:hypothetical protein
VAVIRGAVLLLFLLSAALLVPSPAVAELTHSLLRSPEALAMGGAYTAIVEDQDAPFYNPAGVAAYQGLSIHYADVAPTVSNWVVSGWKTLKDLRNPSGSSLNTLMGQNIYVQATGSAAVLAPGFALVGFYDQQAALYAKNQAFPKVYYGYQTTSGAQIAFGFSIRDGRRHGLGKHDSDLMNEWRFGIGAKYLTRTGGYRLLEASELFRIDSTNASSFIGGKGTGYGGDLGIQRVQNLTPGVRAYWGLAYLNVGNIEFGNGASAQQGDLSTGVGLKFHSGIASVTVDYDVQQLNQSADFGNKQNLGMKVGLPIVDLYAGLHQGFFTYGAAADVWILRASAAVYREALGPYPEQDPEDRFAVRVDLKMDL